MAGAESQQQETPGGVPFACRDGLSWTPLLQDLLTLDRVGALTGIRAIITERLAQVRGERRVPQGNGSALAAAAGNYLGHGCPPSWPVSAALLAAAIDRAQQP